jgi:hypothetical protein
MDFCLEVELDSKQEGRVFRLAVVIDGTLDDVACRAVEARGRGNGSNGSSVAGDLTTTGSLALAASVGGVAGGARGLAGRQLVMNQSRRSGRLRTR